MAWPTLPKPGKRRRAGLLKRDDGRETCRTEYQWQKRRAEVYDRDKGLCQKCRRVVPLHSVRDEETGEIVAMAGEIHHLANRKMGGGSRDDRLENLQLLCWKCHRKEQEPQKVVPAKVHIGPG